MRGHDSGSQENYAMCDLPPFAPPTFFATVLHYGGKKLNVADKPCSQWGKRTGVRCLKPTCLPVPDMTNAVFLTGSLLCADIFDSYELYLTEFFFCCSCGDSPFKFI